MKKSNLGRPTNDKLVLTKRIIVAKAIELLNTEGEAGLSYRKLAREFDVTAMALKHHIGTRKELLKSMVQQVFSEVNTYDMLEDPKSNIRALLTNYYSCVSQHPQVVKLVLMDHDLFINELQQLTETIRNQAIAIVKDEVEGGLMADIIVDYTHGFALAATAQNTNTYMGTLSITDFQKGINWILAKV